MASDKSKQRQLQYTLIERAPIPIFVLAGSNLQIEYVNHAALRLLDRHVGSVLDTTLTDLIPGFFSTSDIDVIVQKCIASRESVSFNGKQLELLQYSQSPIRWLDVDCEPLIDETQQVHGVICYLRDVTPERTLQTSLNSRYEYLNNFFKVAPIAIVCYRGPEFIVDVANNHALSMWGKTWSEVKGKSIEEIFPHMKADPIIWERHLESVGRMQRGEGHIVNEVELAFIRDGVPHTGWYTYIHEPYTDSSGNIIGTMAIAIEVTQQVSASRKLQLITDSLPSLIAYVNDKEQYSFVNKAYENWFGVDRNNAIGKSVESIIGDAYQDLGAQVKNALSGIPGEFEGWVDYKGVGKKYITANLIPHKNENQSVLGFVSLVNDLTERKLLLDANESIATSERELARLNKVLAEAQKVSKLGSWEWDVTSNQVTWSDEMYSIYGYTEKFPVDFTRATERMSVSDAERSRQRTQVFTQEAIEAFKNDGTRSFDIPPIEYKIRLTDGSEKTLRNSGKIFLTSDGKLDKILGAVQDVTEIRSTERQLQLAVEQLEEKNKELEAFSYIASHDLKEPLRKIITYADRLKRGDRGAIDDYILKIDGAATRMMELIESILKFSQLSNVNIDLTDVDLNVVLENCKSDLEVRIRECGAIITSHNLGSIKANLGQMNQLFLNLVGNSLKFCQETPRVNVSLEMIENGDGVFKSHAPGTSYWRLIFSDNGIGFDLKYKEQVFEPFKRLHGRSTYGGAGIGLSIVKKIVDRHKGHIDVDSTPGVGTRLTIYLPAE